MSKMDNGKSKKTIIKKYANRRLYDTGRSSYVTLDDLCEMVQEGHDFIVLEAKTDKDITRSVLTQIIADQEASTETLLPTSFLRTLIGFYGNSMQAMVPGYLEQAMNIFTQNQERIQDHINKSLEGMRSMETMFPQNKGLEELTRRNMELFENAMKMVPPFSMGYMGNHTDSSKTHDDR